MTPTAEQLILLFMTELKETTLPALIKAQMEQGNSIAALDATMRLHMDTETRQCSTCRNDIITKIDQEVSQRKFETNELFHRQREVEKDQTHLEGVQEGTKEKNQIAKEARSDRKTTIALIISIISAGVVVYKAIHG